MSINFNNPPYWDDFDETKNFHRVLFRPGFAVQTRELNQLQTILQQQIETHGQHLFTEGSVVVPGNLTINKDVGFVRVQNEIETAELIGETLRGQDSGVEALVVFAVDAEDSDPSTLFVEYVNSGDDTETKTYSNDENLVDTEGNIFARTSVFNATGKGSIAQIEAGYYFTKGVFVRVEPQTIVLEKYSDTPTFKIGLNVVETIVTPEEDESLNDNAAGEFNFGAPGAHRWRLTPLLEKREVNSDDDEEDFIQILIVRDGELQNRVVENTYSILERTLARRTFDQAGNYTVRSFGIDVREFRNNFRGDWQENTNYLANDIVEHQGRFYSARLDGTSNQTAPTQEIGSTTQGQTGVIWTREDDPFFNRGVFEVEGNPSIQEQNRDKDKYAIGMEPGKAYVNGFEIDKISTEFLPIDKARTVQTQRNTNVVTQIGNFVVVDNVNGLPDVTQFPLVSLRDRFTATGGTAAGNEVGTARVKAFEFAGDTVIGTSATRYRLFLFDIRMNEGKSFARDVRQASIAQTSFTADLFPRLVRLTGSVSASNSTTVTGNGTLFSIELKVGDYIEVNGNRRRVTAISNNNSMTVTPSLNVTNQVFSRVSSVIQEPENQSLVFPLPYPYAKTARNENNNINTSYFVTERFVVNNVPVSSGVASFSISVTSPQTFGVVTDLTNFVVLNATSGEIVNANIQRPNNNQIDIEIEDVDGSTANFVVLASVFKTGITTEKTKTLTTAEEVYTNQSIAQQSVIRLKEADGYRLLRVMMDTGTFANASGNYDVDITERYQFDDGQRPSHYDRSRLVRSANQPAPIAPIKVVYEYFEHSSTGDHFTVNSYLPTISYEDIPVFGDIPLSWMIDFRPRVVSGGNDFVNTTSIPKRNRFFSLDFQYYVSRIDKIAIGETGLFFNVEGSPDLEPSAPNAPSNGMVLYNLNLSPYGYTEEDIDVEKIDNKRYTMRDIGRLEKRIENVEYYTSLSLLEQSAESLSIRDADGFDRFKNGFIVDNFTTQSVGDAESPDFKCSIDMENGELRPFFYMDNVSLIDRGVGQNYQVSGDLVTLPYQEVDFIEQLDASRTENVNPFAVFTFIGSASLTPNTDEWFEVNRLPDVVEEVDNFTAVKLALESAGALGTVWNSWQNVWTGSPTEVSRSVSVEKRRVGRRKFIFFGPRVRKQTRTTTTTTFATEIGQERQGVRTSVVPVVNREVKGDRVVSTAVIPYIRSRAVVYNVKGLKPDTTYTPFFDSVNIKNFIQPATQIAINKNRRFDTTTRAAGASDQPARITQSGNSDTAIEFGDVLFVSSRGGSNFANPAESPATAVVVLSSDDFENDRTVLHVVNVKGTFELGDVVTGTLSGETSTIVVAPTTPSTITSNANGEVAGIFNIPNTSSNRFRTGVREFKLSDDLQDGPERTSTARVQYSAEGVIESRQRNVTATRNAEVRKESVIGNQVINRITRTTERTGWQDPLAQTFLVDSKGGAFITSVDVFFASKSRNVPIRLEIREVVNGYPGSAVLPFSEVLLSPEDVNISSDLVEDATGETKNAPVPTTFKFRSPVYLQEDTEYAIVLISDGSNDYNVWISNLGERSVTNNRIISEQPYLGVLFKSQNSSTWTADQYQDLMFKIRKAQFNTNVIGQIDFSNANLSTTELEANPFILTEGSSLVRVLQRNHGMFIQSGGSRVIISGAPSIAGIDASDFNKEHTIVSAEFDSYVIDVGENAAFSGKLGGTGVRATKYVQFNTVQPVIQQLRFDDTQINYSMRTISGRGIHSTTEAAYLQSQFFPVIANDTNRLQQGQLIVPNFAESQFLGGSKSVILRALLQSSNQNVSPVIDIQRLSLITVRDKIDSPTSENTENFVPETAPIGSSASSKYVTKKVEFVNPATFLKIRFGAVVEQNADVEVYYKIEPLGTRTPFEEIEYVQAQPNKFIVKSDDGEFRDIEFDVDGLPEFDAVQVKIVMKSTFSSDIVRIKDLTIIGCA